jgi:hypothetical protein
MTTQIKYLSSLKLLHFTGASLKLNYVKKLCGKNKSRISVKLLSCILVTLLFAAQLSAQERDSFDQTEIITGDRALTVNNAIKLGAEPKTLDSIINIPALKYQLLPKRIQTEIEIQPIEAAKLKIKEPLVKLYKNYIKAGIGFYATPLIDYYFNSTRNKEYNYGIHYKHFSSAGGINNVAKNSFGDNQIELWGKKFISDHHGLTIGLDYNRNVVNYYGFNPVIFEDYKKEDIQQRFNKVGIYGKLDSYYKDTSKVNHNIRISYYNLTDKFEASENNINLDGILLRYYKDFLVQAKVGFDYLTYQSRTNKNLTFQNITQITPNSTRVNNAILKVHPQIIKQGKNWKALLGIGLYADIGNKGSVYFYPDVEVRYSLFNNILVPYAGLTGGLKRNSFNSLRIENPFILSQVNLANSSEAYNLFGGLRGTFSNSVSFNAQAGIKRVKDHPFFLNDEAFSIQNRFDIVYDRLDIMTVSGELAFNSTKKISAFLKGDFYTYTTEKEAEAWHLPPYKISLEVNYNIANKFLVKANLFAEGKRKAKSFTQVEGAEAKDNFYVVQLKSFTDVNLGAEYRYSKKLSAFVDFNNIFATKYQRWYKFPIQRFMVLGGVTYSF